MKQIRIEQRSRLTCLLILALSLTLFVTGCVSAPDEVEQEFEPRKNGEQSHYHPTQGS